MSDILPHFWDKKKGRLFLIEYGHVVYMEEKNILLIKKVFIVTKKLMLFRILVIITVIVTSYLYLKEYKVCTDGYKLHYCTNINFFMSVSAWYLYSAFEAINCGRADLPTCCFGFWWYCPCHEGTNSKGIASQILTNLPL